MLRHTKADVIHVHSPFLMSWGDLMTCHHLAKPAKDRGVREHGTGVNGALRRAQRATVTVLDDILYRRRPTGTHLSFVSEFLRDEFTTRYGQPRSGWVLPPPTPAWRPVTTSSDARARSRWGCDGSIVVGYLGGVDNRKGFDEALALTGQPGMFPLLAGHGTDRIRCWRGRGIGFVEPDDVLEASDVVVAPALFDAAPVAVVQALARGIPVVVTPTIGWTPAISRHGAGVVWDRRTPLVDAVRRASTIRRDSIAPLIEEFGARAFRRRLLDVYEAVAANGSTPTP